MHKALGRGLESLLPKSTPETTSASESIVKIQIDKIKPNRYQPRLEFDSTKLNELAESIKEHGLTQPIVVTQSMVPGEYELIAGERRLRASKIADIKEVSCIVKQVNDKEKFQLSLIENLQRQDLNPIEEARAYKRLSEEFDLTQEDLAKTLGKERSGIANTLRFLNLSPEIQEAIITGAISAGHGKILAGISDHSKQKMLGDKILREKLTVREIESIVASWKDVLKSGKKKKKPEAELINLCEELQRHLGAKVKIVGKAKKGKIEIHYFSLKELERISAILKSKKK